MYRICLSVFLMIIGGCVKAQFGPIERDASSSPPNSGVDSGGNAAVGGLTASVTVVDFGDMAVSADLASSPGWSVPQFVVINGIGAEGLVPAIAGSGEFGQGAPACVSSTQCVLTIYFTPLHVGPATASYAIGPGLVIILNGNGVVPGKISSNDRDGGVLMPDAAVIVSGGDAADMAKGAVVPSDAGSNMGAGGSSATGGSGGSGGAISVATTAAAVETATVPGTVAFTNGAAVGAMSGTAWVGTGKLDPLTDPLCNGAPITDVATCSGSHPSWNSTSELCISGSIPAQAANPSPVDYATNWGMQFGIPSSGDQSPVLGKIYATIEVAVTGTPTNGLRVLLHRSGDPASFTFCAMYKSGPIPFANFNANCWDNSGQKFTTADSAKIDGFSLMVPSGPQAIKVTDLCMTGITFGTTAVSSGSYPNAGPSVMTIANGKAQGALTGWPWVSFGAAQTITDPVCLGSGKPPTAATPCTASVKWNSATAACMAGNSPPVSDADRNASWGMGIGVGVKDTGGPIGKMFSTISVSATGVPASAIASKLWLVSVHRNNDPANVLYRAVDNGTGQAHALTSLNTAWSNPAKGLWFSAADAPNIDRIEVDVISSTEAFTVTDLCLHSVALDKAQQVGAGVPPDAAVIDSGSTDSTGIDR